MRELTPLQQRIQEKRKAWDNAIYYAELLKNGNLTQPEHDSYDRRLASLISKHPEVAQSLEIV